MYFVIVALLRLVVKLQTTGVRRTDILMIVLLTEIAGALAEPPQHLPRLARSRDGQMDVLRLQHATDVRRIGRPGPQPPDRRLLVAENLEELERKLPRIERRGRQIRYRLLKSRLRSFYHLVAAIEALVP